MTYSFHTLAFTGFSSAILLVVQTNCALPAVFEQMDDGTVVPMADGMAPSVPSAKSGKQIQLGEINGVLPAVLTGQTAETSVPVRPTGAVLVDSVPVQQVRSDTMHATAPVEVSRVASADRADMRQLTAEVGLAYAHEPAVSRANLDEESFVDLFSALIRQESGFDPHAVSPAGARGLGQLMPGTARDLGVRDVFSPRDNLDGSARYLTAMLDEFGSPALALAAYNAGPGAVRQYGGIPPFPETHAYVAGILEAFSHGTGAYRQFLATSRTDGPNGPEGKGAEIECNSVPPNNCQP